MCVCMCVCVCIVCNGGPIGIDDIQCKQTSIDCIEDDRQYVYTCVSVDISCMFVYVCVRWRKLPMLLRNGTTRTNA